MTGIGADELRALSEIALSAAEEAAALVHASFRTSPRVEEKGPHDLVTEFDRASEALLAARLGAVTPDIAVVGEESAKGATSHRDGLVWYVDPIDGTTNFVHGHPFWCVSVGLMHDDVPVAGAVVAPSLGIRWSGFRPRDPAPRGAGPNAAAAHAGEARRNGARCAVSGTASLRNAMIATGFPPVRDRAPDNNFDAFVTVKRKAQAVRRCGSAAIDLCMVADGTYDAYWERRLHAWDIAAGCAIVRGAGGLVTGLEGGRPDYHKGNILVSNGLVHEPIVHLFSHTDTHPPRDPRDAQAKKSG
jgi:myo-inositol-1(or 4)-monophosphatase